MRSGGKTIGAAVARKHYTDLYMIKHVREILAVISIITAPAIKEFSASGIRKAQIYTSRFTREQRRRLGVFIVWPFARRGFPFARLYPSYSRSTQWCAIDTVRSCEIPTTANVCRFGRFYELLVARVRPWYRHSLRCISFSSRILDPGYLHSRVYFALKELSTRLILAVSRPPTSFPYPRWWNLPCYCAVKTKWNYRIFSRTLRRPGRAKEKEAKAGIRRCCRRRSQYVFLPPRDAISHTPLANSAFVEMTTYVARDCFKREHGVCRIRCIVPELQCLCLFETSLRILVLPHTRRI